MSVEEAKRAVLVVGHGSRRVEANDDVREAARQIGVRGEFPLIAAAFLEIEHPNILEGFAQLVAEGARHITVHPYFLSPGRHTRGDLPGEVFEAASRHGGVTYEITEPLAAHPLVIAASVERILETRAGEVKEREARASAPEIGRESKPEVLYRAQPGVVYLVGAGPGDPALLTIKARDLLVSCDVVIYDNLVNPELLRHAPASAELIDVGKIGGGRQTPQERINRLLIERARTGKRVVRLKGGDPFLFGRGGEEAEALHASGIEFEIVPGISSALSVPAYAGIPLTHRGLSSSVTIITGARAGGGAFSAETLSRVSSIDTVVVLMGAAHLREIADGLMAMGRSFDTPAAVIRWGTYEGQQTVTATLQTIADEAERKGMRAPSVIIVGEVVGLRERLKWFERGLARADDKEFEDALASY
jgi:uroporphyrin-III C-methyltransferase